MSFAEILMAAQRGALSQPNQFLVQKPETKNPCAEIVSGELWTPEEPLGFLGELSQTSYRTTLSTFVVPPALMRVRDLTPAPAHTAIDPVKLEALKKVAARKIGPRVPDAVAPVVAWRAWSHKGGSLRALGYETVWPARKPLVAACASNDDDEDHAPAKECGCGIWAFNSLETLRNAVSGYYNVKAFGEVYLWGRIIECENGFRAQYAYPKELWLPDESLEQLGYTYNVPVRTIGA